jgi:hypothetical protein
MLVEERGETWVDGGHFRNAWTVRSDWLERPSAPRTHLTMEMVLFRAGSSGCGGRALTLTMARWERLESVMKKRR